MNTAKRARLAAVPMGQLNLATQRGQREYRRRARRAATDMGNSWSVQTGAQSTTTEPTQRHRPAATLAVGGESLKGEI